jgi:uncharacterized DUF497 family protein
VPLIRVEWDNAKNEWLKTNRNVCFEDVENAILEDRIIDIVPHFNLEKYPNQELLIVKLYDYVYYVPFVLDEEKLFLKSIIPSRKYNKLYGEES